MSARLPFRLAHIAPAQIPLERWQEARATLELMEEEVLEPERIQDRKQRKVDGARPAL
jgi:hypothetical protein